MSTAIIGNSQTAVKLSDQLGATLLSPADPEINEYDTLLLADEPITFPDTVARIAPLMKAGQAVIVGCGSIFATWAVTKALFAANAPDRIIVGMCDAWSGNAEDFSFKTDNVLVSAHNFVYTPFLSYVLSEAFDNVETAASPLALGFRSPTLIRELAPIALAANDDQLLAQAREETLEIGRILGTIPNSNAAPYSEYHSIQAALNAAVVTLYPLLETAAYIEHSAPAVEKLLKTADLLSDGRVSKEGAALMPNLKSVISHDHQH